MVRTLVKLIHQTDRNIPNLGVLSCVGMCWFGILRNGEFAAVLVLGSQVLDHDRTLLDKNVCFGIVGQPIDH